MNRITLALNKPKTDGGAKIIKAADLLDINVTANILEHENTF